MALLLLIAVAIVSIALFARVQQRRRQWKEDEEERVVTMAATKYNPYPRATNNNHRGRGENSTAGCRGGSNRRERRRNYQQKRGKKEFYNDANNNDDNHRLLFIISALEHLCSYFRSYIISLITQFVVFVTSKTDNAVSKSTSFASYSDIGGGAYSLDEYYSNTIVIGLDCEMVGAGRGGKDSMLARCSVVTLDFVPNEHGDDDDDDDDEDEDDNYKNDVVEENVSTCTSVKVDEGGLTTTTNDNTTDFANYDHSSNELTHPKLEKQRHRRKAPTGPLDTNLIILYDKYVIPRRKVTDYRTEWSGITKETYAKRPSSSSTSDNNNDSTTIPIVTFETCKHDISQLFASINGKNVIVVGHGLVNDFDVLEITHPISNIRDTSTYKPYQRETRKKLYPRKLSTLTNEELGIHIQQQKQQQQQPIAGHSSVEDAAAALRLYWHKHVEWERSLGYPLLRRRHDGLDTRQQPRRKPLKMYLDGCNLPISCRGVNFNDMIGNNANLNDNNNNDNDGNNSTIKINNHDGRDTTIIVVPSDDFQIISRMRQQQQYNGGGYQTSSNTNISTAIIDWMPIFKSALWSPQSTILDSITIMFDGAKYENLKKYVRNNSTPGSINSNNSIREELGSAETWKFRIDTSSSSSSSSPSGTCNNGGSIMIEITDSGDSTDDVLVYTTSLCKITTNDGGKSSSNIINNSDTERRIISLEEVIDILSNCTDNDAEVLSHYIVIRRKAGGTKTHRRLFDKLHLRRPNEGALCLSSLTMGLHKNSLAIARELRREKSINSVIECELRDRDELRHLVVTNDVYLTDRLVRENRVLVLSYNQFTNMW